LHRACAQALYEAKRGDSYQRANTAWEKNMQAHDKVELSLAHKREAGE
jgi:hypothetical protein